MYVLSYMLVIASVIIECSVRIEELLKKTFKNLLLKKNVINVLIILSVFYLRKEILVTMIHIVT